MSGLVAWLVGFVDGDWISGRSYLMHRASHEGDRCLHTVRDGIYPWLRASLEIMVSTNALRQIEFHFLGVKFLGSNLLIARIMGALYEC